MGNPKQLNDAQQIHLLTVTLLTAIKHTPALKKQVLEVYSELQYGIPFKQLLVEGDDDNPYLKTKTDHMDVIRDMLVNERQASTSLLNAIYNSFDL